MSGNARVFGDARVSGDNLWVISGVGSERGTLTVVFGDPIWVSRGCFAGSLADFAAAVEVKHRDSAYGVQYRAIIAMLRAVGATKGWFINGS